MMYTSPLPDQATSAEEKKTGKILLVEDDKINALLVLHFLKKQFLVDYAAEADSALLLINHQRYDFILMNINLGHSRLDGILLMRIARQQAPHTKVLALTRYSQHSERLIHAGFDACLIKPIDPQHIVKTLYTLSF